MTWQAWALVGIVIGALALFASEKLRADVVALLVLSLLMLLHLVTPTEALSGFSNEATITVAAMFALSLGIDRSGALDPLMRLMSRIRQPWLLTLAIMLAIAPIGAFVKNTALVATFLPLALKVCQRTRTSPGRVLMPMAYAAQMGGVCTLLGTSSNLLADSIAREHGLAGFGVFEFTHLGFILAIAGIAYLMIVGRWLLPLHVDSENADATDVGKYVAELRITPTSPLIGKTIAEAQFAETYGVYALELMRGERQLYTPRAQHLAAGDELLVRGEWDKIVDFRKRALLEDASDRRYPRGAEAPQVLAEVMIAPASTLEGRTLGELEVSWQFAATALAIHRRGHIVREKMRDTSLEVGDVLLMLVDDDALGKMRSDDRLIVLSEREDSHRTPRKAFIAIGIMAAVVIISGLRWMPIPVAAICGAVAMALAGCYGRKDAYLGIDWKIIIMLGAFLPLGIAMDRTGLSDAVVQGGMAMVGTHGPLAALLMVYLLTALLTELMGHNPSVVLMAGIAVSVAHTMHVDPRPFVVAVAFAAATSFATPVGYPTNTMVYYAGGYRFTDFMKVGIPLIALFCVISMYLIPYFWPFHP